MYAYYTAIAKDECLFFISFTLLSRIRTYRVHTFSWNMICHARHLLSYVGAAEALDVSRPSSSSLSACSQLAKEKSDDDDVVAVSFADAIMDSTNA